LAVLVESPLQLVCRRSAGPDLDDFHRASKEEAMRLMTECEHEGLMHSIWTFQTPFTAAICNCNLESGCMAMRLTAGYKMKLMWRGEYVAQFNRASCTDCGSCADVCPFGAIESTASSVVPRLDQCWGRGICRTACPSDAISLTDRRDIPAVATLW
jgi:heterodisulfide reductase subunit A-like polyferredoxin